MSHDDPVSTRIVWVAIGLSIAILLWIGSGL